MMRTPSSDFMHSVDELWSRIVTQLSKLTSHEQPADASCPDLPSGCAELSASDIGMSTLLSSAHVKVLGPRGFKEARF